MKEKEKTYVISFLVSLSLFVLGLILVVITLDEINVLGLIFFMIGTAGITVVLHSLTRDTLKRFGIDPDKLTQTDKSRLESSRKLSGYLTFVLSIPILLSLMGLANMGLLNLILPIWLIISFLLYIPIDNIFYVRRYKSIRKLKDKKPFNREGK